MNGLNIQTFYNHSSFMNDVREGDRIIAKTEKELAKLSKEESPIQVGDLVQSSGSGTYKEGTQGKVLEKFYNNKFLAFKIDWDFATRKRNHSITIERLQDIKEI